MMEPIYNLLSLLTGTPKNLYLIFMELEPKLLVILMPLKLLPEVLFYIASDALLGSKFH